MGFFDDVPQEIPRCIVCIRRHAGCPATAIRRRSKIYVKEFKIKFQGNANFSLRLERRIQNDSPRPRCRVASSKRFLLVRRCSGDPLTEFPSFLLGPQFFMSRSKERPLSHPMPRITIRYDLIEFGTNRAFHNGASTNLLLPMGLWGPFSFPDK